MGNLLFLGPTGSGKTRVVEAVAESLFGDAKACIKIDCAEFQHSHEIAKLIGSPPGYLGHRETHPLLTQEALNQYHTEKLKLSILLFDEIEKASDSLWQLLLGILDKATLTLGDNRRVDLSHCIIIMTSNLGAAEMNGLVDGGLGFAPKAVQVDNSLDEKITRTAIDAARRKFAPEFMNRIDKVVVFKTLRSEHLKQILEIELGMVQQRVLMAAGAHQFVFNCTPPVKDFLLARGNRPEIRRPSPEARHRTQHRVPAGQPGSHRTGKTRRLHPRRPPRRKQAHIRQGSRRRNGPSPARTLRSGRHRPGSSRGKSFASSNPTQRIRRKREQIDFCRARLKPCRNQVAGR